jgi:hypothetical protein
MVRIGLIAAFLSLVSLASCGDDATGACAELEAACASCVDGSDRLACLAIAEDNEQDDCGAALGNPCFD